MIGTNTYIYTFIWALYSTILDFCNQTIYMW
uniref:Uncharacterized protein n=1 Tax=Anguilla anguilla TaxID=7936 RepID=A0A0E9PNQ7_ANGAN